jgi:hypothetical protein
VTTKSVTTWTAAVVTDDPDEVAAFLRRALDALRESGTVEDFELVRRGT